MSTDVASEATPRVAHVSLPPVLTFATTRIRRLQHVSNNSPFGICTAVWWVAFALRWLVTTVDLRIGMVAGMMAVLHGIAHVSGGPFFSSVGQVLIPFPFVADAVELGAPKTSNVVHRWVVGDAVLGITSSETPLVVGVTVHHPSFRGGRTIGLGVNVVNLIPLPRLNAGWLTEVLALPPMLVTFGGLVIWSAHHVSVAGAQVLAGMILIAVVVETWTHRGVLLGRRMWRPCALDRPPSLPAVAASFALTSVESGSVGQSRHCKRYRGGSGLHGSSRATSW